MATTASHFPRFAGQRINEALFDTPVVVLNGARQAGKSTLAADVLNQKWAYQYVTLDDPTQLAAAQADPYGFVDRGFETLVIDEVQRAPDLLLAIKSAVDRDRRPGKFLLTGSTRLFSTPKISESLAGRVEIIDLWPLSQSELLGRSERFVDALFEWEVPAISGSEMTRIDYLEAVCAGGFPEALSRTGRRRSAWFENYASTVLQRMVSDIAEIDRLELMPALLRLCAARTSTEVNVSALGEALHVPRRTLSNYLSYLQTVFLVQLLPAWSRNFSTKVIHKPKLAIVDTGLAAHVLGVDAPSLARPDSVALGPLFENFISMEIRKQLGWSNVDARLHHFRDRNGVEVDCVLETRSGLVAGVEIKAASTVGAKDFRGLKFLQKRLGSQFAGGVVLYTGPDVVPFGKRLAAVPASAVWQTT